MTTPDLSRLEDIYKACHWAMPDMYLMLDHYWNARRDDGDWTILDEQYARLIIEASLANWLDTHGMTVTTWKCGDEYVVIIKWRNTADESYTYTAPTKAEALALAYLATKEETTK